MMQEFRDYRAALDDEERKATRDEGPEQSASS
jgi:hypothetical protein